MIPGTGSLSSTHAGLFGKGKEIYNDDVDRKRGGADRYIYVYLTYGHGDGRGLQ